MDEIIKKAVEMRVAAQRPKAKIGKEKFIDTAHGKVRVLEYGFGTDKISPLFIDMHGGGFILAQADDDELLNEYFRECAGVKIVSIDYPKAPEHPYPEAVEAIYEIVLHYYNNARECAINPDCIGVGGHSAGANLAAVTCIRAKQLGTLPLKYQILDYPSLDLHTDPALKPSPKNAIPPDMAAFFNACYVAPEKANNPCVSPIFAEQSLLTGLPPALMIVAGFDSLHDEGVRYVEMLRNAGVDAELRDYKDAAHGFTFEDSDDAKDALRIMAEFIKSKS